jgi:peptidoglycan/LPS O-acetylase OafA/YrhL
MLLATGIALITGGLDVDALQVRWAVRTGVWPLRLGHLDQQLPARTRRLSNLSIVLLVVAGAQLIGAGDPWWVRWLVIAAALAVAVALQAVVLGRHRRALERAGR